MGYALVREDLELQGLECGSGHSALGRNGQNGDQCF